MLGKAIIQYHTKNALKNNQVQRENIAYGKTKKIGIIHSYVSSEQLETVYQFFDQLEGQGKKVQVIVLKDKKTELNVPEFSIVDYQELTNLGKWNSETIVNFFEQQFDYLFHLDLNGTKFTDNILANSKAKCRVGIFSEEKEPYYELMIHPEENSLSRLIQQIYHYIKRF